MIDSGGGENGSSGTGLPVHEVLTVPGRGGRLSREFRYVTVDRDDLIVALREKGRSFREIARQVGCSFGTARKIVQARMPGDGLNAPADPA